MTYRGTALSPGLRPAEPPSRALAVGRWLNALTVLLALSTGGCAQLSLHKMRTDFVALRYLDEAIQGAQKRPLDRQRVLRFLDRAVSLAPEEPIIKSTAPRVYVAVGAFRQAEELLRRQPNPDPMLLGQCLLKLGKQEAGAQLLLGTYYDAMERWRQGKLSEMAFAIHLNNVGYLLTDAGVRLDLAKPMLEAATRILPLDANCLDSLGWLYYRLGDNRRATFYLERAVRMQGRPAEAEILYHLGAAYSRDGRHARARKVLRLALRLDPQHEEALQELKRLRWLLPTPRVATAGAAPSETAAGEANTSPLPALEGRGPSPASPGAGGA